jgi:two-component system, OmpR family, response regulator
MKKILVVDDEIGFTRLLKLNLERTGRFTVRVVNESTHAVEAAREFHPDLALLDIVMPDLDGGELVHRFRADPQFAQMKILMLTALVAPSEIGPNAVAMSGDLLMVAKPVDLPTLLAAIDDQLGPTD